MQDEGDLDRAAEILNWNKRTMSLVGLWPRQRSNFIFFMVAGYFTCFMGLGYLDLYSYINDLERVISNLTESMTCVQIFVRIIMLRVHNDLLGQLIEEMAKDFDPKNYKADEELQAVVAYTCRSKIYIKLIMVFVACSIPTYYTIPILTQLGTGLPKLYVNENVSETLYLLPYKIHLFYEVEDVQTYVLTYAAQMPIIFCASFGQAASDCVTITLAFHICGQMSVLAMRINDLATDSDECSKELKTVIKMHGRLLWMGKSIQDAFSVTLLAYLLSATSLLCIIGYQILMILDNGEKATLFSFFSSQMYILLVLYIECTIGENLLTESAKVCEAFYNCKWYDMPFKNSRCIILCVARSQKPLCLTAGKFSTLCLNTFTNVVKTSMGYLSVLRSLL